MEKGLPIIKWKLAVKKGSPEGCNDERLDGTFVFGAPANLTKNISSEATEIGIHNGTKCTLHAIGYDSMATQQRVNDAVAACGVGEVVWVETPNFIVVDVGQKPGLAGATRTSEGNVLLTLEPGESNILNMVSSIGECVRMSCVTVQDFDVDLAWAITRVHSSYNIRCCSLTLSHTDRYAKLQGATLERIVIDLTRYDVPPYATFEMILVALSRARTGDGIRYIGCK
jgi:hypothetical protein